MAKLKTVSQYKDGILKENRAALAQAITLIESQAAKHKHLAQQLMKEIYSHTGKSIRIGFTGVPGAGKSTLINAFGTYLCDHGYRVAVLAIDPSSTVSGGSILGDKTRMEQLAKHPRAFVRPSPSQGTLGGVHRKTREAILLCEAAGYDVIFVETMGVGQGEGIVKQMVDVFILLVLTGAGDELQGIKKGILELADLICVNKADGDNRQKAVLTKKEYESVISFLYAHSPNWQPKVLTTSIYEAGDFINLWNHIADYKGWMIQNGQFEKKRGLQLSAWLQSRISDYLYESFYGKQELRQALKSVEQHMQKGHLTMEEAFEKIIHQYEQVNQPIK